MWQPIETAPKDGTTVLVYFRGGPWSVEEMDLLSVDMSEVKKGKSGFYGATHWMPLPEPPE